MTIKAIDFKLDHLENSDILTYRSFGVTTVRLKVSSETMDQPPLRLRAGRQVKADQEAGTFRGFPEESEALMVSWGGGHEPGPCVNPKDWLKFKEEPKALPKGEETYIYFNLTHINQDELPETADLKIEAFNTEDDTVVSTLTIRLQKPANVPDKIRRIVPDPAADDSWVVGAGANLPTYDPRWFPEGVGYTAEPKDLALKIRRLDNVLKLYWGHKAEPIVTLTDNTSPSILTPGEHHIPTANTFFFELFNFDAHHVVLRVWFYWLNRNIGRQFFVTGHEVPDAERFDFILRKKTGQAIFVCTDLHWSEVWGEVPEDAETLEVSLGLNGTAVAELLKENLKKAREKAAAGTDRKAKRVVRSLQAAASWLGWNVEAASPEEEPEAVPGSEAVTAHNPVSFIRDQTRLYYEKAEAREARAKGSEAHVPFMHRVIEYHRSQASARNLMVSNDVRRVLD